MVYIPDPHVSRPSRLGLLFDFAYVAKHMTKWTKHRDLLATMSNDAVGAALPRVPGRDRLGSIIANMDRDMSVYVSQRCQEGREVCRNVADNLQSIAAYFLDTENANENLLKRDSRKPGAQSWSAYRPRFPPSPDDAVPPLDNPAAAAVQVTRYPPDDAEILAEQDKAGATRRALVDIGPNVRAVLKRLDAAVADMLAVSGGTGIAEYLGSATGGCWRGRSRRGAPTSNPSTSRSSRSAATRTGGRSRIRPTRRP